MKSYRLRSPAPFLLATACTLLACAAAPAATWYVDITRADNNGPGTSWATAYKYLQTALAASQSGDEILVAQGTYKPTTGTDRSISFQLKSGVAIYGGYDSSTGEASGDPNLTILSGDLSSNDASSFQNRGDNSRHVVTATNCTAAVLECFTISGGNADGTPGTDTSRGGGAYISGGSPTITNCVFTDNRLKI